MVRSVALAFTIAASAALAADRERAAVRPGEVEPDYWSPWTPLAPEEPPPAPLFPSAEAPGAPATDAGQLPPPEPDPRIAPVVGDLPQPPAARASPSESRWILARAVLGLTLVVALAFAATHPSVERLEQRLGIAQLVTAGVPFLLLGIAARHPAVDVLDDRVLVHLGPVLRIALGWIGFIVGFRFDGRRMANLDERAVASAALFSVLPFLAVVAATGVVLAGGSAELATALRDRVFLRDALVLGAAASMAAATLPRLLRGGSAPAPRARFDAIVRLEELAGVAGLALVAAYFRPAGIDVEWQIPGAAWLFITVGAGALLGLVTFGLLHRGGERDFTVLAIGSVAFASGAAGYLHLSSVAVCFVAAVVLGSFGGRRQERFREAVEGLERPIYLVLLVILGALWPTRSLVGWLLIPVFVGARFAGRWLAARAAARSHLLDLSPADLRVVATAPVGSLAIAIVVNAQLLYPGGSIADAVVAVVGGALVTEGLVHAWARPVRRRELGAP